MNIVIYLFFSNFTSKSEFDQFHPNNIHSIKFTFQIEVLKHKSCYTKFIFDQNQVYKIMLIQNQFYKF